MPKRERRQLEELEAAARFALGGRATFTLVSRRTGTRFTFKVSEPVNKRDDVTPPPLFVKVLTGPENGADYSFVGTLFRGTDPADVRYSHGRRTRARIDAPSVVAIRWFVGKVVVPFARGDVDAAAAAFDQLEFWHEGRCGMCGRTLTVPESIASGIGPVCAGRS